MQAITSDGSRGGLGATWRRDGTGFARRPAQAEVHMLCLRRLLQGGWRGEGGQGAVPAPGGGWRARRGRRGVDRLRPAAAALPAPTPIGDDIGFFGFAVVAELTSQRWYQEALRVKGLGRPRAPRRERREQRRRAPTSGASTTCSATAPSSRATSPSTSPRGPSTRSPRALALGQQLEGLLVSTYLYGASYARTARAACCSAACVLRRPAARVAARPRRRAPRARACPTPVDTERAARCSTSTSRSRASDENDQEMPLLTAARSRVLAVLAVPGGRAGRHRLRGGVAARRVPEDRRRPDVQLPGVQPAAGADRARRTRRPVRVREPERAGALFRGVCARGPVTFATNIVVLITPKGNPSGSARSTACGRARGACPSGPPASRSAPTLARSSRGCELSSILRSNRVSLDPNVAAITAKVALGSADAGFVYVTDAQSVAASHRGRRAAQVVAAAGPLPDVRRAPRRCGHRRGQRVHREGPRHERAPDPAALRVRPPAARLTEEHVRERRHRGEGGVAALSALIAGIVLTFLALPIIALFTEFPLARRAGPPARPVRAGRPRGHRPHERDRQRAHHRARARRRPICSPRGASPGRSLVITLIELPLVLPPAVAGIALLAAFGVGGLLGPTLTGRRDRAAVHAMGGRPRGDVRRLAVLPASGDHVLRVRRSDAHGAARTLGAGRRGRSCASPCRSRRRAARGLGARLRPRRRRVRGDDHLRRQRPRRDADAHARRSTRSSTPTSIRRSRSGSSSWS